MLTLVLTRHGSTTRSAPEQHLGQHLDLPLSEAGRAASRALGERLAGVRFDRVIASPLLRARETASLVVPGRVVETDARLLEMDYGRWEGLTYEQIETVDGEARRRWEAEPAGQACPGGESGDQVARRVGAFLDDLIAWASGSPRGGSVASTPASALAAAGRVASAGAPSPAGASSSARAPSPASASDPAGEFAAASASAPAGAFASAGPSSSADGATDSDAVALVLAHSTTNRVLLCVALGVPVRDYRRRFVQAPANLTVLRFPGGRAEGAQLLVANDIAHVRGIRGVTWG